MLNHNVNNIHAKQLHFDVSIIYTETVHCIAFIIVTFIHIITDTHNRHIFLSHFLHRFSPIMESLKLTNLLTFKKKKKDTRRMKGTYIKYGLSL